MIKGLYNENEFYANFYWDNKLLEDVRAKLGNDTATENAVSMLKNLDSYFWAMKEAEGPAILDAMTAFYQRLFIALGYQYNPTEKQTTEGKTFSVVVDTAGASPSELLGFLVGQSESGAFEASPIFFQDDSDSEKSIVDYELSELLREELQESQNPPRWVLVGAPNALFLIERSKWAFGRYIRVEWQEIFLQRDTKPYEVLLGLTARKILCPDSGNSAHDEFDDNSHRHAFEVTTELRESVREAIELLINEMIDLKKESHQKIYAKDSGEQFAKELTHDALYYVYRLLFLLYLEAQGDDSDLLPLKSEIYRNGYSLEKLLELDFVDIAPDSAESKGTFLFESLERIFNLIFFGFEPGPKEGLFSTEGMQSGFLVKGIKSDLFDPDKILHLKGVKLSNGTLLEILKRLSLTRRSERGGRARSRISYAILGINQLGAVYEGLLSYTGFFAQEELHALKPKSVKHSDIDNGKELDQIYLAPKSIVEKYRKTSDKKIKLSSENTVLDKAGNPKIFKKGSFIYRLAGRDRQKLASYYTPESLTKCTVKYALKVLFEKKKTLEELWNLKILEPAMGSGAFLNEAVNQLADRILEHEIQLGIGDLKGPKSKQKRLWNIKYELISNNIYGVDLNPTAIELARFSLWLNCVGAGKEPPSFGGRLKVGNSLIGARFRKNVDGLFPWLMLDDGMFDIGKRFRDYDQDGYDSIKEFRSNFLASKISGRNEDLERAQRAAETLLSRLCSSEGGDRIDCYRKLKLCCDLWCSLFFVLPSEIEIYPESHSALLSTMAGILEGGTPMDDSLAASIYLKSQREAFFHWELEFPEVLATSGFDLILGNPPWVAVDWRDSLYLSDYNVVPNVLEMSAPETREFTTSLKDQELNSALSEQFARVSGYTKMLEVDLYSSLKGTSKNTYKAFDVLSFYLAGADSVIGLIQEDGLLDDRDATEIRAVLYRRLRYHFQFWNQKKLFAEVGNTKSFSINIFGNLKIAPSFKSIANLFLPVTIDLSLSGQLASGDPLGLKTSDGDWDVRGFLNRVVNVDHNLLATFARVLKDPEAESTRFLKMHTSGTAMFLKKMAAVTQTVSQVVQRPISSGQMINETNGVTDEIIQSNNIVRDALSKVVLSGPNIEIGNFLFQQTINPYNSHRSYEPLQLSGDSLPRTLYGLRVSSAEVDKYLSSMAIGGSPYRNYFRLVTRRRIDSTNARCFFTCIIPPGVSHINTLVSIAFSDVFDLLLVSGLASSIVVESLLRLRNAEDCYDSDILDFPFPNDTRFADSIRRRVLVLNNVSKNAFNELFDLTDSLWDIEDQLCLCDKKVLVRNNNTIVTDQNVRQKILAEIDALVALSFDVSYDEFASTYLELFTVLKQRDEKTGFDRLDLVKSAFKNFEKRGW